MVTITANKEGNVFTPNANPGKDGKIYGFFRVEEKIIDMTSAVARVKVRSALKSISQDDYNKAKDLLIAGTQLPGRVRIIETTDKELADKKNYQAKMAGSSENAQPCLLGGAQIFRGSEYDATGKLEDILVQHDNVIVGSSVNSGAEALNG